MGEPKTGWGTLVSVYIEGINVGETYERLEWKAAINNGYIVRARISDPYFNLLKKVTENVYLKKARKEPVEVKFWMGWLKDDGTPDRTEERIAYMINLYSRGAGEDGRLEFIAIDPPTWLLSRGKADGKHYKGSVSDVIKRVANENGISEVDVTTTIDNKSGDWWMMRQDPKTFILSLLNWSSSVTGKKTKWVVTSKDKKLVVKEEFDLQSVDYGLYKASTKEIVASDLEDFELLMDNFSHIMYSEEHTAGISAVSGYFIDRITEPEKSRVYDKNTGNKSNTKFGDDRGFDISDKEYATFKIPIPENSAGLVGIKYQDYIDGRARQEFLDMVGYIMRARIRVDGGRKDENDKMFDDPTDLGVSTVTLQWIGLDESGEGKPYFLAGHWMVTGYHHVVEPGSWHTDLYINRLDYNAAAKKVGPSSKKGK